MNDVGNLGGVEDLPRDWADVLADEVKQPYWADLQDYVAAERELSMRSTRLLRTCSPRSG